MKNCENTFLSNSFRYPKEHFRFEGSQAWPFSPSNKSIIKGKVSMGNWLIDPDRLKLKYSERNLSQCQLDWPEIEHEPAMEAWILSKSKFIPYLPWNSSIVERSFGWCCENCTTHITTWCGKNADFQMKFEVNKSVKILINVSKFDLMFELISLVRKNGQKVNLNFRNLSSKYHHPRMDAVVTWCVLVRKPIKTAMFGLFIFNLLQYLRKSLFFQCQYVFFPFLPISQLLHVFIILT